MLPETWLSLLDASLRGAMLAWLLLLAANLLRLPRRWPIEQLGLGLALGLCVQLLASWPPVEGTPPSWWRAPLVGVSMGNSLLFWLWVRSLCDDDFRPRPGHTLAWAAVALAGALNIGWLLPWCFSGGPGWAWGLAQGVFALPLIFGLLAVAAALRHWRDDLVERRRWLRLVIVVGGCGYTLLQVGLRRLRPDNRLSPEGAVLELAVLLFVVAAACWLLLRPQRDELTAARAAAWTGTGDRAAMAVQVSVHAPPTDEHGQGIGAVSGHDGHDGHDGSGSGSGISNGSTSGSEVPEPVPAPPWQPPTQAEPKAQPGASAIPPLAEAAPLPDPAEGRLAAALQRAMLEERAYKDPALSVAGLAARLQAPEYRLRRLINQRLGQRHFNAYLNGYRLAEVKAALADPAQQHLPVLTLALEAGFGSIGPFNRAFKADTGLTPTDFRRLKLADS